MGFLTDSISDRVVYRGRQYLINASFDTVLMVQKLFREEELSGIAESYAASSGGNAGIAAGSL